METVIDVLDKQIADIISDIQENTIKVGDLFLKVYSRKNITDLTPDDMINILREMNKMSPLIARHENLSAKLETLQNTKYEIEQKFCNAK